MLLPPVPPPLDPPASLDPNVKPGDDFYHYADGGWLKNNPIPSDHTSWGSFNILTEHNNDVLHVILDDCAAVVGQGDARFHAAEGRRLLRQWDGRSRHRRGGRTAAPAVA